MRSGSNQYRLYRFHISNRQWLQFKPRLPPINHKINGLWKLKIFLKIWAGFQIQITISHHKIIINKINNKFNSRILIIFLSRTKILIKIHKNNFTIQIRILIKIRKNNFTIQIRILVRMLKFSTRILYSNNSKIKMHHSNNLYYSNKINLLNSSTRMAFLNKTILIVILKWDNKIRINRHLLFKKKRNQFINFGDNYI